VSEERRDDERRDGEDKGRERDARDDAEGSKSFFCNSIRTDVAKNAMGSERVVRGRRSRAGGSDGTSVIVANARLEDPEA
jgi:hypothetical protein